ncbi:hypothetical protein TSUD_13230 [Trifolium subterraneum]|uniref:Putative plant transposon protein domain-containing protein n=1 Tax=Trifolium subterraneum TaxID=3900 RepID=A0A2Z6P3P7_TRISU|nr:hypothetical protein TSUD_13230 [Trifolium subterraneum]
MSPKKSTGNKKQKIGANASTTAQVPANFQDIFFDPAQFARFQELQARKIWPENEFSIMANGKHRSFVEAIENLGWGKLIDPGRYINPELVSEFYANALPTDLTQSFPYTTKVRNRHIRFDRDAINDFLGKPYTRESEDDLCDYVVTLAQGLPLGEKGEDMIPMARLALLFILHNVIPRSHISDVTMPNLGLIYCLFKGSQVDIAKVISQELKEVFLSSTGKKKQSQHIDDKHVERWCYPKKSIQTQQLALPQFNDQQPNPPQFTDQQLMYHLMDHNTANHRADVNLYEAMYQMSLNQPLCEPSHFYSQVAWPGDMPQFGDGVGTFAGANDDGVDDPIDEDAADAFVSNEGDGENTVED